MAVQAEEIFNHSFYNSLLPQDKEIIDEYLSKLSVSEINSFMARFINHYSQQQRPNEIETIEDEDAVLVFEKSNISKIEISNNFINHFINTTKSANDINEFFAAAENFDFMIANPHIYKNSSLILKHIVSFFNIKKSLRPLLESSDEIDTFVWEGIQAYFTKKRLYQGFIYNYIGGVVKRKIIQNIDINLNKKNIFDENSIEATIHHKEDNKIPYDRIFALFKTSKKTHNKAFEILLLAFKEFFKEEYNKSIDLGLDTFLANEKEVQVEYIKNIDNYLNDKQLQSRLYYNNVSEYKIGWIPDDEIEQRIRELYIDLAQKNMLCHSSIVKNTNISIPLNLYTYRVNKQEHFKQRLGAVLENYGQNFKISNNCIKVICGEHDLTSFIKNVVYWSPKNAQLHGFNDKTGIIWFDGFMRNDHMWEFSNDLRIKIGSDAIVNVIYTTDAFLKMYQRFNLKTKLHQIVSDIEFADHV